MNPEVTEDIKKYLRINKYRLINILFFIKNLRNLKQPAYYHNDTPGIVFLIKYIRNNYRCGYLKKKQ